VLRWLERYLTELSAGGANYTFIIAGTTLDRVLGLAVDANHVY